MGIGRFLMIRDCSSSLSLTQCISVLVDCPQRPSCTWRKRAVEGGRNILPAGPSAEFLFQWMKSPFWCWFISSNILKLLDCCFMEASSGHWWVWGSLGNWLRPTDEISWSLKFAHLHWSVYCIDFLCSIMSHHKTTKKCPHDLLHFLLSTTKSWHAASQTVAVMSCHSNMGFAHHRCKHFPVKFQDTFLGSTLGWSRTFQALTTSLFFPAYHQPAVAVPILQDDFRLPPLTGGLPSQLKYTHSEVLRNFCRGIMPSLLREGNL